jgi:hypothetical protein
LRAQNQAVPEECTEHHEALGRISFRLPQSVSQCHETRRTSPTGSCSRSTRDIPKENKAPFSVPAKHSRHVKSFSAERHRTRSRMRDRNLFKPLPETILHTTSMSDPSSASTDSAAAVVPHSVPLPRRSEAETLIQGDRPPVWSISSPADTALSTPLPIKCDRHGRPDGICCKDLKDDDDRQLIDPDIVRDVYGAKFFHLVFSILFTECPMFPA